MQLQTLDVTVLVIYIAAVIGFGCWFVRKSGTTSEFMSAGGRIPGWAVGLSIFGTYLSSNTFLGNPGKAYASNWNAYVFTLTLPLAAWIATRYFVPFYRRSGEISAYEHFEKRFGPWARTYAVCCYLLTQVARMGAILFGVALGLNALTGWDIRSIILVTGILVTLYTLLGGIEAVIWTDVVQSIVLMVGAVLILGVLWWGTPGGVIASFQIANNANKLSLGSWAPDLTTSTVWPVLLYSLFINLTNFGIDQSFVQRYHTADSEAAASRAVWVGAIMYVPISLLFFVIGSSLYSYYQSEPALEQEVRRQVATEMASKELSESELNAAAEALTVKDIGDRVLPHFIQRKLPAGIAGLIIAAIFAAAMSSVDTSLNSSATVLLEDIYSRYFNREPSEESSMTFLRWATVVMGLVGTGIALALINVKSILDAWWALQGVFAGGLLGLFLLSRCARNAGSSAAAIGIVCGILVIAWVTFSAKIELIPELLRSPFHTNMAIVLGTLTIFLVGLSVNSLFARGSSISGEQQH